MLVARDVHHGSYSLHYGMKATTTHSFESQGKPVKVVCCESQGKPVKVVCCDVEVLLEA